MGCSDAMMTRGEGKTLVVKSAESGNEHQSPDEPILDPADLELSNLMLKIQLRD